MSNECLGGENRKPQIVNFLWQRRSCRQDIIYCLNRQVGEGDDRGSIAGRVDKDADGSAWVAWFADAELITPVQEQAHLSANRPYPNTDFARRARWHIAAGEGRLQGQARSVAHSIYMRGSITR